MYLNSAEFPSLASRSPLLSLPSSTSCSPPNQRNAPRKRQVVRLIMASSVDLKLLKSTKFPSEFNTKVDMKKVNVEVMKK